MLFQILLSLFPKSSEKLRSELIQWGVRKEADRHKQDTYNIREFEAMQFHNKLVIAVSNEHDDLVIGRCSVIPDKGSFIYMVKDYVKGNIYNVGGKLLLYTPQRFDALMKLEPCERCSLMYQNSFGMDKIWNLSDGTELLSKEEVHRRLVASGFMQEYINELTT